MGDRKLPFAFFLFTLRPSSITDVTVLNLDVSLSELVSKLKSGADELLTKGISRFLTFSSTLGSSLTRGVENPSGLLEKSMTLGCCAKEDRRFENLGHS